jgi:hypothetical protein
MLGLRIPEREVRAAAPSRVVFPRDDEPVCSPEHAGDWPVVVR